MSSQCLPLKFPIMIVYSGMITLILGFTTQDSLAQHLSRKQQNNSYHQAIAAGTRIPVRSLNLERILITEEETLSLGVIISADLYSRQGKIILPSGSQITGELQPVKGGIQFITYDVYYQDQIYPIQAISQVISRRQRIESQEDILKLGKEILMGKEASQSVATLLSRQVELRELAEWILGRLSIDLILIYPNRDLTLTLESDFLLD